MTGVSSRSPAPTASIPPLVNCNTIQVVPSCKPTAIETGSILENTAGIPFSHPSLIDMGIMMARRGVVALACGALLSTVAGCSPTTSQPTPHVSSASTASSEPVPITSSPALADGVPADPKLLLSAAGGKPVDLTGPIVDTRGTTKGSIDIHPQPDAPEVVIAVTCTGPGVFAVSDDHGRVLGGECTGTGMSSIALPPARVASPLRITAPGEYWIVVAPAR